MKIISSGSDRSFIIFKDKVILIDPNRENLKRYIDICNFLQKKRINVPKIYKFYPNFVILKNLGKNFYSQICNGNGLKERYLSKYQKIMKEISKIHKIPLNSETIKVFNKFFDLRVIRWEWQYFLENYALNYKGYYGRKINKWLYFSEVVINSCYNIFMYHKNLIHRDLQSTNIIFYTKDKPFFIDFQGMIIGNFLYDLASLIEDPYVSLPNCVKSKLLDYYFKINDLLKPLCRFYKYYKIQRLVQVLGAFAFLSIHKNKEFFIKHLKNSEMVLKDIMIETDYL